VRLYLRSCAEVIRDLLRDYPDGLTSADIRDRAMRPVFTVRNSLRALRSAHLIECLPGGEKGRRKRRFRLPQPADIAPARAHDPAA
jgi:hypothetical protein